MITNQEKFNSYSGESLLVVAPAWVGDMIMAQSLFITLHQTRMVAKLDVIAPPWSLPLLTRMPEVNRAIPLPVGHGELALGRRWRLGKSLRSEDYSQAIILPRTLKSAIPPFIARVPCRTGYLGECRYGLLNDIRPLPKGLYRTVDRYLNLGLPAGASFPEQVPEPRLMVKEADQQRVSRDLNLVITDSPVLALCPGAEYGPAKQWPTEHFASLARMMIKADWQVWLMGSGRDREVAKTIAAEVPEVKNLAGRTELAQVVDLLSLATAVVSNDSGLMHVAAAVDVPVIGLYGSSDPNYTPPLSDKALILCLKLKCSPCFKPQCPQGHLACLRQIDPEQVKAVLDEIG